MIPAMIAVRITTGTEKLTSPVTRAIVPTLGLAVDPGPDHRGNIEDGESTIIVQFILAERDLSLITY